MLTNGISKIAAPRWYKELKRSPSKFIEGVGHGSSQWGQSFKKNIQRGAERKTLQEGLFGGSPLRTVNLGNDISISDPLRRSLYFKANKKHYKALATVDKAAIGKNADRKHRIVQHLRESNESAKKYLEGKSPAKFTQAFRSLGSKDNVDVKHATFVHNSESIMKGYPVKSPSASIHGLPTQGLFTFPKKSKDTDLFVGTAKQRAEMSKKHKDMPKAVVIHAKVPESSVTYGPPTIRPSKQKDAELYVHSDAVQKAKKRLYKLK